MRRFIILLICFITVNCDNSRNVIIPTIEFSKIPPVAEGGSDKSDIIEGRVIGSSPGQRIVLFAKSGTWWVQPLVNDPFTEIQENSTWKNKTHLGTEYAALLVEPDYRPPAQTDNLPTVGDGVIAVKVITGVGEVLYEKKTIKFSGYEWNVRTRMAERVGTQTKFDPQNVWTDEKGFLHLRITKNGDGWNCAEIGLPQSLGYGKYIFVTQNLAHLEPATVLSAFTWDDLESGQNHREMNMEFTKWGDAANKNMQYVIQPYYLPSNVSRFNFPPGILTHSMDWKSGSVNFKTIRGIKDDNQSSIIAEHQFLSGVPNSEGETFRLGFYVFGYSKTPQQKESEIVIEKFQYLP